MTAPTRAADDPGSSSQRLRFGDSELDLSAQRLLRFGAPVPLQPRHYAVLVHLARSGGRLVAKDELLDAVWGHRHVSDSVLKVAINAVRAALGDDARAPRHVETVPRRGYRFLGVQAPPAGPPPAAPARRVDADAPGNLPPAAPGLIGRDGDVQRVRAALAAHRLVTLHGPGGVGKTRLALAVAGADAPPDGVWLLRLESLAADVPLAGPVAHLLGLGAGAEAGPQALARALGGLQLRLVVDNAEHLQAAVAELAAALLAAAPGVQLLVTSQVPLHVAGEQVLPLAPLALPDSGADAAEPAAALQLLLQRVRQQQPDAVVDAAARADAAAICHALDGLPLALELAAARVPLLGWSGVRSRLVERLGERLSLLTRGAADAVDRHRTLRAALAWTHGLLAPAEQQVLAALSVFAGGFTLAAAVAVAGPDDADAVLDAVDSLRDRSLLVRAGDGEPPRWRLYDSVRSLAAESLAASPTHAAVRRRFVGHLAAVFEAAEADFATRAQRQWLARWRPEGDNLQAALQLALHDPALQPDAVRLFAASADYRVRGGWRREALRDHGTIAGWAAEGWPIALRAAFDLSTAQLASIGQLLPPRQGLEAAWRAVAHFAEVGDVRRQYLSLYQVAGLQVRLQAPLPDRAELLARMKALEPPDWGPLQRRHRLWQDLMLARDQGRLALFEELCAAYMATGRALGDDWAAWNASQALAQSLCSQQRLDTAIALLERSVGEMRACGELRRNAHVLAQSAALRILHDAEPATVQSLHEAARLMHADDRLWWMADALAWVPAWQGRWHDAVRVQAWADDLVRRRGDLRGRVFGTVRSRFDERLAAQPEAARWQALLADAPGLDETTVLALVFGGAPAG